MVVIVNSVEKLNELLKAPAPLVLHVGAKWCAPCETINSTLDQSPINVLKAYVDAEEVPQVAEKFDVDAVPTVLFLRPPPQQPGAQQQAPNTNEDVSASVIANVSGSKLPLISQNLNSLFGMKPKSEFKNLNEYLAHLIGRDRIVVFITGTPSQPRCGFTSKLIDLLDKLVGAGNFTFVDIMEDEEVCQGLKKYSDWPTYPQVYVSSELVGGLDICLDMHAKGKLGPMLAAK